MVCPGPLLWEEGNQGLKGKEGKEFGTIQDLQVARCKAMMVTYIRWKGVGTEQVKEAYIHMPYNQHRGFADNKGISGPLEPVSRA